MNAWAVIRQVLGGVRPVTSLQNVKSAEIQILHNGVLKEPDLFSKIKRFLRALANVGLEVNPERIARDDKNSWIGTAAAFCDFMGGFGLRLKEMRTGVSQVTFGYSKLNDQQKRPKIIELADYGWTTAHQPLCEMITFPPEKQGSMARTVGPLTQVFKYLTTSGKYREKWLRACLITFAHVPNISGLLELIGGKPVSEIRPVLRELGNLALLVTARNSNRATPAPSLFSFVLADQRLIYGRVVSHSVDNFGPYYAKHLDFSGKGAFMLYKLACKSPVLEKYI